MTRLSIAAALALAACSASPRASPEAAARLAVHAARFSFDAPVTPRSSPTAPLGPTSRVPLLHLGTSRLVASGGYYLAIATHEERREAIHPAAVRLPMSAAREAEVVDEESGVAVRFSLEGARDVPLAESDGLAVFAGAAPGGGDVIHRASGEGVEDFVVLEERPAEEKLAWTVDVSRVAGVRLVSNTLEFLDDAGAPRLRVRPPWLLDARGVQHPATLAVAGCAFDADPRAPWGRAITAPGARTCEVVVRWGGATVAYPAVLDPSWVSTGNLAQGRFYPQLVLLGNGQALIVNGNNNTGATNYSTAELFDPGSATWAATGDTGIARTNSRALLLPNGQVVLAGGTTLPFAVSGAVQLYDPSKGTWSRNPADMPHPSYNFGFDLLANGKVLQSIGGAAATNTSDFYDPAANAWSAGPLLKQLRTFDRQPPQTVALAGGQVVVFGGTDGKNDYPKLAVQTEVYDPASNAWNPAGNLATPRSGAVTLALGDGTALAVGGFTGMTSAATPIATAEVFTVSGTTGAWTSGGAMAQGDTSFAGALLGLGTSDVVVGGGTWSSPGNFQEYVAATKRWSAPALCRDATRAVQAGAAAVRLASGTPLFAGGGPAGNLAYEFLRAGAAGCACASNADCASGRCGGAGACAAVTKPLLFIVRGAGPAAKVAFTAIPSSSTGTDQVFGVSVSVEDSSGNVVTTSASPITLSLASGPSGATFGGTLTVSAISGVATFTGLSLTKSGTYTLTAKAAPTVAGVLSPGTSGNIVIVAGPPTGLYSVTDLGIVPCGAPFQVAGELADAAGNPTLSSAATATLALKSGPAGGALLGPTSVAVSATTGIATFAGISLTPVPGSYVVVMSALGFSAQWIVRVGPGLATSLVFTQIPSSPVSAGAAFTAQVGYLDGCGTPVVATRGVNGPGVAVSLATQPGGATLGGTLVEPSGNTFIATFADLTLNRPGAYTLSATDLTVSAVSGTINVVAGFAASLVFLKQPPNVAANVVFPVTVGALDAAGNAVPIPAGSIQLTLGGGDATATLAGTLSEPGAGAQGGATFTDLAVNKPATAYTLTATDIPFDRPTHAPPPPVTSAPFNVASDLSPLLDPVGDHVVFEGQALPTIALHAISPQGFALTYSLASVPPLPANAVFNATAGTLAWTPGFDVSSGSPMAFAITFTATDSQGLMATRQATITVLDAEPALDPVADIVVAEGQPMKKVTLHASDPQGLALTFAYAATPPLPGAPAFDAMAGTLAWTPGFDVSSGAPVAFAVTFTATDTQGLVATRTATITVVNTNRAPVIAPVAPLTTMAAAALAVPLTVSDPDGNPVTCILSPLPAGATYDDAARTLAWTPGYEQLGDYLVTATCSDGMASTTTTIAITVTQKDFTRVGGGLASCSSGGATGLFALFALAGLVRRRRRS